MALKLKCPCGERLTAPESAAGKRGKCSKCGMRFIIPSPQKVSPSEPESFGSGGLGGADFGISLMHGTMSKAVSRTSDESDAAEVANDWSIELDRSSRSGFAWPRKLAPKLLLGFAIGAVAGLAIALTELAFHAPAMEDGVGRRFLGLLLISGCMGTVIAYLGHALRQRNCPRCGKSMGNSQNSHAFAGPERATETGKRLPWIISGYGHRGRAIVRIYYLCKTCDTEFVPEELPAD